MKKSTAQYLRDESAKIVKAAKKARKKSTDPEIQRKYKILEEEFGKLEKEL